jgi:hypothetical protein
MYHLGLQLDQFGINLQGDSNLLLLGFPFIGHGNPDSNLESPLILQRIVG